ncbi:MAG TPA: aminofutalosine synthase MqnE, partial [Thermodesulforhabdus norvegica]|nr:aminofutalosine synthase MqnE [Thermodesulforhabdus norvegica]
KRTNGNMLCREGGIGLCQTNDLIGLAGMAHTGRRRLNGKRAYFVRNRHINYSNICVNGCAFCAYGKQPGEAGAFELTINEIVEKVTAPDAKAITEVHIVGGCHPSKPFSYYEEIVRAVKQARPSCIVKAFTAVEVEHFARLEDISVTQALERLKEAGLDMMPGGGAEIFAPSVRSKICPKKLSGEGWLSVMETAHRMGIPTNATMLFGHIESIEDRVDHLIALRELQDKTNGFVCFIPLPFLSKKSPMSHIHGPTGVDILKTIAVSRLMLDNILHIKAYWVMLTVKLAQLALCFGADDFDGTVMEEKIGHMAGAESEDALTVEELQYVIQSAGFEPVERDSFFNPLRR